MKNDVEEGIGEEVYQRPRRCWDCLQLATGRNKR